METWSRSCAADSGAVGGSTRWPAPGDLTADVAVDRLHAVSVTLEEAALDLDEMLRVLRRALARYDVRFGRDDRGRTVLVLMIVANDLWLAVLVAMNAVTATGYVPVELTAGPVSRDEAERGG